MTFEKIKNYFINKKQKEQVFYLVEFKNEETMHIAEQKLIEIMLVDCTDLQRLVMCGYAANIGWHVGENGRVYEKHLLTDGGKHYYEMLKIKNFAPKYMEALEEMNNHNINPSKWAEEKGEIRWNFKKNRVKSIQKYDGRELQDVDDIQEQNVAIL